MWMSMYPVFDIAVTITIKISVNIYLSVTRASARKVKGNVSVSTGKIWHFGVGFLLILLIWNTIKV